jgi:hypothetical protein
MSYDPLSLIHAKTTKKVVSPGEQIKAEFEAFAGRPLNPFFDTDENQCRWAKVTARQDG